MNDLHQELTRERFTRHMRGDELDPPPDPIYGYAPEDPEEAMRYIRYDDQATTKRRGRELMAEVLAFEKAAA